MGYFTVRGTSGAWFVLSPTGEPIGDSRGPITFASLRAALRFADAMKLPVALVETEEET